MRPQDLLPGARALLASLATPLAVLIAELRGLNNAPSCKFNE